MSSQVFQPHPYRRPGVSATQHRTLEALANGGAIDRWGTVRGGERVFQRAHSRRRATLGVGGSEKKWNDG